MEEKLIQALQQIATGEIVGETKNYKDSLYIVKEIAKEAIDEYFKKDYENQEIKHNCRYSKAMNQPYPRLCVDCGKEEPKQVWEQIIEDCGGEEEFMKSAGLLPKQETLEEVPTELESVLAKITHQNDLGLSQWYEVVYYDDKWCSYSGSKTFEDGEKVIEWKYCKDLI